MTDSPRSGVLQEAIGLIDGDRTAQYGPPTQDFQRTAAVLNSLGYFRKDPAGQVVEIVPSDVAILVMAVKLSRLMHSRGKRDNWVDLAGYAGCGYECSLEEPFGADWQAAMASLAVPGPTCEASGMSEAECVATDICDCFGVGDNRLSPPDTAAEVINELTAERDAAAKERDDARGACKRFREELERLRTGETCQVGQPAACGDYHNAGQCVRTVSPQERKAVDALAQARAERDQALKSVQELRDEKFLGGDQSTISNLRSQLKAFEHHAEDNKELREENRRLARELAEATEALTELKKAPQPVPMPTAPSTYQWTPPMYPALPIITSTAKVADPVIRLASYAGEPVDAADA